MRFTRVVLYRAGSCLLCSATIYDADQGTEQYIDQCKEQRTEQCAK